MRVGLSASSTSSLDARAAVRHALERTRVARDAGLDSLTFGDSHARSGANYLQNVPTLARCLVEWDPQRPAGCLFLVPMWNPVLLAEQVGTLAAFHDGPFIVQTGLGGPAQFAAMGVEVPHRGRALEEAVRVVQALFAGETVSSEMFGIVDAAFDLVPPDGVSWWFGTMSEAGVRRAARLGGAWYALHAGADALRQPLDTYREECAAVGTTPYVAARREALILHDGDRARQLADEALAAGYRGMTTEQIVAGSPAEVGEQLAPLVDLGIDEVMLRTMGIDPATDLETLACAGEVRAALS